MQSHLEGSHNFIAWTYTKGRWPIKDKATRVKRHRRREKLKDVTFCVRHIFIEKETTGWKLEQCLFSIHCINTFGWKSKSSSLHICNYPKGGTQTRIQKTENAYSKRKFQIARPIRNGIKRNIEISAAKATYKRSALNLENRAARFQKFNITRLTCEKSQHLKYPEFLKKKSILSCFRNIVIPISTGCSQIFFSSFWAVGLEGSRTNLLFGKETLGRKANPCSMCGTTCKKGSQQKNVIHLAKLQSETAQTSDGCSHKTWRSIQSRSRLYLPYPDCTRAVLEQEYVIFPWMMEL